MYHLFQRGKNGWTFLEFKTLQFLENKTKTTLPRFKARLEWTSLTKNNSVTLVHSGGVHCYGVLISLPSWFLCSFFFFFLQCFGCWYCQTLSKITCCISTINLIVGTPLVFSVLQICCWSPSLASNYLYASRASGKILAALLSTAKMASIKPSCL